VFKTQTPIVHIPVSTYNRAQPSKRDSETRIYVPDSTNREEGEKYHGPKPHENISNQ